MREDIALERPRRRRQQQRYREQQDEYDYDNDDDAYNYEQHGQPRRPQGPQVRNEQQVLEEAIRLMQQGNQEQHDTEGTLVLEQYNGGDEPHEDDDFLDVELDEPQAPVPRPRNRQLARPTPVRPHRQAQAATQGVRQQPDSKPGLADMKKPQQQDTRFLHAAARKRPVADKLIHYDEDDEDETGDSMLDSGSIYIPFPAWMDFAKGVPEPSSADLRFNVPQPGVRGEARDIFTMLTKDIQSQSNIQPQDDAQGGAVEALAKKTAAFRY
jgi:hypothetical protein